MSDYKNMLSSLRSPSKVASFACIVFIAIYRAASVRFLRGFMVPYPPEMANLAMQISDVNLRNFDYKLEDTNIFKLKLAIGHLVFDSSLGWKQEFSSHEEFVSLHRWNWLLRGVDDNHQLLDVDDGMALIRSWLTDMGVNPRGEASQSYTVGERISNLCLFSRQKSGKWNSIPDDIKEALRYKAKFLAHRLEFLPGNLTGNHLINNARALLLVGHSCDLKSARVLSRAILTSHLKTIIDNQGFLREGSSHYQFLVTRWLLEIRMISEELRDFETLNIIRYWLPKMVNACEFFLVESSENHKEMVLFGDISPDCEPSWLIDITNSPLAQFDDHSNSMLLTGWARLFEDWIRDESVQWLNLPLIDSFWYENVTNGWYRLDYCDWVAIWHVDSPSGSPIASHAHSDFGSPVIYLSGKEVLIDVGRFEYENNEMSTYGVRANAHSALLINGLPMVLSRRDHLLPTFYRDAHTDVSFKEEADLCKITIKHDGFKRIKGDIGWHTREFTFTEGRLKISDLVEGTGEFLVETFFQIPALLESINDTTRVQLLNSDIYRNNEVQFDMSEAAGKVDYLIGSDEPVGGWRFRSFGEKESSVTIKLSSLVDLPFKSKYEISRKQK